MAKVLDQSIRGKLKRILSKVASDLWSKEMSISYCVNSVWCNIRSKEMSVMYVMDCEMASFAVILHHVSLTEIEDSCETR